MDRGEARANFVYCLQKERGLNTTERYRELPLRSAFFWPCPDGPRAWTTKSDLISPKAAQNAAIAAEGGAVAVLQHGITTHSIESPEMGQAGLPHPFTLPIVVKCPLN